MAKGHKSEAAAERKRLRDRVAQQNLRNKRNSRIHTLEQQVKMCHELHGSPRNQDNNYNNTNSTEQALSKMVHQLTEEKNVLEEKNRQLLSLVNSCEAVLRQISAFKQDQTTAQHVSCDPIGWHIQNSTREPLPEPTEAQGGEPGPTGEPSIKGPKTWGDAFHSQRADSLRNNESPTRSTYHQPGTTSGCGLSDLFHNVQPEIESNLADIESPFRSSNFFHSLDGTGNDLFFETLLSNPIPPSSPSWTQVPLRTATTNDFRYSPWDSNVLLIINSPDQPLPLDLLFGSRHNPLASTVQRNVRSWYGEDPERLAIGWLAYHFIKWRTTPSLERFARLPDYLQPIREQTWVPHPGCLDMIFWKDLRLNLLQNYGKYNVDQFLRTYCRCLRLRWSRDEEFLVPAEEGPDHSHTIRPEFMQFFMREDNWGLLPEIINQYPELFASMDCEKVIFQ